MQRNPTPGSGINLSLVVGALRHAPVLRADASGEAILTFELAVRPPARPVESVPVVWAGAPSSAIGWPAGLDVLAVGRVRRRFFRVGGAVQSRTEVVATTVVPTRRRAAVARSLARLREVIEPLEAGL